MKPQIDYSTWIGERVSKSALHKLTQPKPFKSGLLLNTVKALTVNPNTGKPAFTFLEDESIVDCYICEKGIPKNVPDDTIYRTPNGTRVRIVKAKEFNSGQVSPMAYAMETEPKYTVVAEVSNGKRWYGYTRETLLTEEEYLKKKKST